MANGLGLCRRWMNTEGRGGLTVSWLQDIVLGIPFGVTMKQHFHQSGHRVWRQCGLAVGEPA
jgi:hypothetical protein